MAGTTREPVATHGASHPAPAPVDARAGALPFTGPWLLAPMEGVTDPAFRNLVLSLHTPQELGGGFTEFVRVLDRPTPTRILERHLGGPAPGRIPVGIQLMGSNLEALAESARRAAETRAAVLDLNFGCPAKGALRGCAGSALLRDPAELRRVVATCVEAVEGALPVTAKIRAGFEDAEHVEELARAAEGGGAALLTVHCRTKAEGYCEEVDWTRIARAVASVSIPVCGNGGVERWEDLERMRRETGCALVMVGRGALADPWIFSGRRVSPARAARFLLDYADEMVTRGAPARGVLARLKQLLRVWTAGELIRPGERQSWMEELDVEVMLARLRSQATS